MLTYSALYKVSSYYISQGTTAVTLYKIGAQWSSDFRFRMAMMVGGEGLLVLSTKIGRALNNYATTTTPSYTIYVCDRGRRDIGILHWKLDALPSCKHTLCHAGAAFRVVRQQPRDSGKRPGPSSRRFPFTNTYIHTNALTHIHTHKSHIARFPAI